MRGRRSPAASRATRDVWHSSAIPGDLAGREAIVPALEAVARQLAPLVTTFCTTGEGGEVGTCVAHGSYLPPTALAREVGAWMARLDGTDPLAGERVQQVYDEIGVIGDAGIAIREGARSVAGMTLWRAVRGPAWSDGQLRLLATLRPLVEMAYLSTVRAASSIDARLPATLTGRQRQVARLLAAGATNADIGRALFVSPNTAKSHARAVLAKLGVASRRELAVRFRPGAERAATTSASDAQPRVSSIRVEGDETPARLLAALLDWGAERIGAAIAGCGFLSARAVLVAQAWAAARPRPQEPDPQLARLVQQRVLAPAGTAALVGLVDAGPARTSVVQLERTGPPPGDHRLAEVVADAGLTMPLVAVLRRQGRVAGLVWVCRDARGRLDERASERDLRSVQPLLELTDVARLAERRRAVSAAAGLADLGLTSRELTVARLALAGESNAAIAGRLQISEATVKRHVSAVLAKCGVRSRTQLIALFGRAGDDA